MSPELENEAAKVINLAAQKLAKDYSLNYTDTRILCWEWLHASEKRQERIFNWLESGRQKQAMYFVVDGLRPRQKRGHRDQFNYSVQMVTDLLPMAQDPDWALEDDTVPENDPGGKRGKKPPGEWGNQIAMVCDVRRALQAGMGSVAEITDWLNGGVK